MEILNVELSHRLVRFGTTNKTKNLSEIPIMLKQYVYIASTLAQLYEKRIKEFAPALLLSVKLWAFIEYCDVR